MLREYILILKLWPTNILENVSHFWRNWKHCKQIFVFCYLQENKPLFNLFFCILTQAVTSSHHPVIYIFSFITIVGHRMLKFGREDKNNRTNRIKNISNELPRISELKDVGERNIPLDRLKLDSNRNNFI